MRKVKQEVITFKVDESMFEALKGIPNRSDFIRTAILSALDNACPLCKGTGVLSQNQKNHWNDFLADHTLKECEKCSEVHLICSKSTRGKAETHADHG